MRTLVPGAWILALIGTAASIAASHLPAAAAATAARVGDTTTKGIILPPGATTVIICGRPAARVGDLALSTTSAGPLNVPTNVQIVVGSSTVLIAGKPAARAGDATANGDKILVGCPTVTIGG
jgi:uncharacterized Zn-binding protein involved in type VI secretion